jgi:hypothetical protein
VSHAPEGRELLAFWPIIGLIWVGVFIGVLVVFIHAAIEGLEDIWKR